MCKIMVVPGIKKKHVKKAWKIIEGSKELMSYGNSDGLGVAGITSTGEVFGRRWLYNTDAFVKEIEDPIEIKRQAKYGQAAVRKPDTSAFGTWKPNEAVSILLHTRYATSSKGLLNCHPFVKDNTVLIHNGVIRNDTNVFKFYDTKPTTTCDSESILAGYMADNVSTNPKSINELASNLQGYYAVGVLSKDQHGPIVDIFKSSGARLQSIYVKDIEAEVYCTEADIVKEVCDTLGYVTSDIMDINDGWLIRHNAVTGDVVLTLPFTERVEKYSAPNYGSYGAAYINQPVPVPPAPVYPYATKDEDDDFAEIERRWLASKTEESVGAGRVYDATNGTERSIMEIVSDKFDYDQYEDYTKHTRNKKG